MYWFHAEMIITLLKHSSLAFWRSNTLGRSLFTTIFTYVMIFLIMLYVLGLGLLLERLLNEFAPANDVIATLHGLLVFYWMVELIARLVLQKNISLNIQYYLTQNVPRTSLVHFMLIKSLKNLFLLITFLLFTPFAFNVVAKDYGLATGLRWLLFMGLISLVMHYLTIAIQQFTKGNLLMPLFLVLGLLGTIYLNVIGVVDFTAYSSQITAVTLNEPLWLALPVFVVAVLYYLDFRIVLNNLSLESLPQRVSQAGSGISYWVNYLNSYGLTGQLVALELRLIWRNKRPRTLMLSALFMMLYFIFFLFRLENSAFVGAFLLISTGAFMVNYGQLMFSWESGYYDFILTRSISAKEYLSGKFVLFLIFNTMGLVVMAILLIFINTSLLKDLMIWYLINSGMFIYIFIWGTMLGPKPIDVNARAMFNYEGINAFQFLVILPYFLLPLGTAYLMSLSIGEIGRDIALMTIGLTGLMFYKPIIKRLAIRLNNRKYKISNGFRE